MTDAPTIHQARTHMIEQLMRCGKTLQEIPDYDWEFNLCEDSKTIMVMVEVSGETCYTSFDWRADPAAARDAFLRNRVVVIEH